MEDKDFNVCLQPPAELISKGGFYLMSYQEDKEPDRCGIGIASTEKDDPFVTACHWHDHAYTERSWHETNLTRKDVDKQFLLQMLTIAGDNRILKARAYLYYSLARLFGSTFWEDPNADPR